LSFSFLFYHQIVNLDWHIFQLLSLKQREEFLRNNNELFTYYIFVHCLKYYDFDSPKIEFVINFIKNILPVKYLTKICSPLGIMISLSSLDESRY
jgi:hypothetical protein